MELINDQGPLVAVIVAVLAVLATVIVRRRRGARAETGRPIANAERLTDLRGYRAAVTRYRTVLLGFGASALVLLVASVTLASRPATMTPVSPDLSNRDIVLCLDVSGSMVAYDAELVDVFGELAENFDGERISLVVFNASAVTYFPLTSDYRYIAEQFRIITEQFASDEGRYFAGTFFGDGSSLIGDGLASCAQRFDTPEQDRSRSIILATDNLLVGEPIFTLPEAGALAADRGIRVYGINPGDQRSREYLDEFATEFREVVEATGGSYYALADPAAIGSIVDSISAEQATVMAGAPQLIETDQPATAAVFAFLGLAAMMLLAWRLRR